MARPKKTTAKERRRQTRAEQRDRDRLVYDVIDSKERQEDDLDAWPLERPPIVRCDRCGSLQRNRHNRKKSRCVDPCRCGCETATYAERGA